MSVHGGLDFDLIKLQAVNLFVGISGSGKSKLLHSLFDAARFAIGSEQQNEPPLFGSWSIEADIAGKHYKWDCQRDITEEKLSVIKKERIEVTDQKTGIKKILV